MNISLKNVRTYEGLSEETVAFAASVYVDGKKVGDAKNNGQGGPNDVDVFSMDGRWDRDLRKKMESEARKHTWTYENQTHQYDLDSYIGKLVDDFQEQRYLKRLCRTQTLLRIPNQTYKAGEYTAIKLKYNQRVKARAIYTWGNRVEILNESFKKESK